MQAGGQDQTVRLQLPATFQADHLPPPLRTCLLQAADVMSTLVAQPQQTGDLARAYCWLFGPAAVAKLPADVALDMGIERGVLQKVGACAPARAGGGVNE